MFFNITNRDGEVTLSVFPDNGEAATVAPSHPNYERLVDLLVKTPADQHDEPLIERLLNPAAALAEEISEATGGEVTYRDNNLFYDGLPFDNTIARHVLRMVEAGEKGWERLLRFVVNLQANPSYQAQRAVLQWVDRNGLTITEDGHFLGYKSVDRDGKSSHSGPNNFIDGTLLGDPGVSYRVPHKVGTVISKRRADVDDNRGVACSTGLHVGTQNYASGFAARLLMVKINPADVVSIPDGELDYKIRTCRYEVLGPAFHEAFTHTEWTPASRDEVTADEVATALANPGGWSSDQHEFSDEEHAEYDSLDAFGRTLYDMLRTMFAKTHDAAFASAQETSVEHEVVQAAEQAEREAAEAQRLAEEQAVEVEEEPVVMTETEVESMLLSEMPTMDEKASASSALRKDLRDPKMGHKPLARKWKDSGVTETSVRRWRKANGVEVTGWTKVKDALS